MRGARPPIQSPYVDACVRTISAATQIHSSLLSISVGAVLLPAAFHFALTYSSNDANDTGTTLQDQKEDILKMSHGVSARTTRFIAILISTNCT